MCGIQSMLNIVSFIEAVVAIVSASLCCRAICCCRHRRQDDGIVIYNPNHPGEANPVTIVTINNNAYTLVPIIQVSMPAV